MKIGDRVASPGSHYVGTVIKAWAGSCVVQYDVHGRYLYSDRIEYKFNGDIHIANRFEEWHNACAMRLDGIAMCFPLHPFGNRFYDPMERL